MDSQPTAKAFHSEYLTNSYVPAPANSITARINADISQLLQRFENIMATATVRYIEPMQTK